MSLATKRQTTKMFERLKSGIFAPAQKKPVGVQCSFCPEIIWKHKEAGGRLFLYKNRPICARCRILKGSKYNKLILGDKKRFEKDVELRNKIEQDKADEQVRRVAAESQKDNLSVKINK